MIKGYVFELPEKFMRNWFLFEKNNLNSIYDIFKSNLSNKEDFLEEYLEYEQTFLKLTKNALRHVKINDLTVLSIDSACLEEYITLLNVEQRGVFEQELLAPVESICQIREYNNGQKGLKFKTKDDVLAVVQASLRGLVSLHSVSDKSSFILGVSSMGWKRLYGPYLEIEIEEYCFFEGLKSGVFLNLNIDMYM